MREDDGRRLDHATLEAIRRRAVRAVADGERPAAVAKRLPMSRAAVYAWLAQARAGGPEALAAKPIPGRPPKLSDPQVRRIYELLVTGSDPRALRFRSALWTRALVQELIVRECGVALSRSSVGRLLGRLGLSSERPRTEVDPTIRAAAAATGAEIDVLAVARLGSDVSAATLLSARSAPGRRRFAVMAGPLSAATCIAFCDRLLHDAGGPVILIVEDHPVYRSPTVRAYLASTRGALRLVSLPADAAGGTPEA